MRSRASLPRGVLLDALVGLRAPERSQALLGVLSYQTRYGVAVDSSVSLAGTSGSSPSRRCRPSDSSAPRRGPRQIASRCANPYPPSRPPEGCDPHASRQPDDRTANDADPQGGSTGNQAEHNRAHPLLLPVPRLAFLRFSRGQRLTGRFYIAPSARSAWRACPPTAASAMR